MGTVHRTPPRPPALRRTVLPVPYLVHTAARGLPYASGQCTSRYSTALGWPKRTSGLCHRRRRPGSCTSGTGCGGAADASAEARDRSVGMKGLGAGRCSLGGLDGGSNSCWQGKG